MAIIIGVDCATDPRKVGLAKSVLEDGRLRLVTAEPGDPQTGVAARIAEWIQSSDDVLIALDAPLGWPASLGDALHRHSAGMPIQETANLLFRRETDRFIKRLTGKQPLDVGADRIARTAHSALVILQELRTLTGKAIPLAWEPEIQGVCAIEVYPAGTLLSYGLPATSYKDGSAGHQKARERIIEGLSGNIDIGDRAPMIANADVLDAVVCCIAAADFLRGQAVAPDNRALAGKEGWIWVRASE